MQDINYSGNHCEIQSAEPQYIDKDHVDPEIINTLEGRTKAQSDSDLWNNVCK
ncbi:hypothetical protein DPMN_102727 [Dreissena polymorpha]|uniref:Uncharacterized protein n=1 Tax=Dreissena polymorpha TaxID=45954 RepID=A0A9D4R9C7_DREPO|nr:hypothetical protein DPMN_102727 [Dreissena polymorpha]